MLTLTIILIVWAVLVDWPDRDDPRRHPEQSAPAPLSRDDHGVEADARAA